jgi:hypothetical protein
VRLDGNSRRHEQIVAAPLHRPSPLGRFDSRVVAMVYGNNQSSSMLPNVVESKVVFCSELMCSLRYNGNDEGREERK